MADVKQKPVLIIVQGFLGAGKTTFSKNLAKEENAVRMNADEWCFENFLTEELEANWDGCFAQAVQTIWQSAEELLAQGKNVVMDLGFWSLPSREHARGIAKAAHAAFRHYYVYAPDEILISRLKQRQGAIAESNLARFEEIKKSFEEPLPDEQAIKIDNF